ncbi:TetR/AcrR family transcriptional regulator [Paenibacillus doosanensis]|uniref:A-factor receptor protein n=1 Tax=Paenibacillus konkukensis TaxID=2020716 RepID=A0ABY4RR61_9BACL|nr:MULTISPECIES: TetR/AcrR family transcriptional regulator [Paenibacillus]MCS7459650.1 TetR/AcrR family transcriptional regulator [Paenibacillus doosanensis]UQZ84690.1 A-factor receptor protein [Paenibacillus konkukensis]
MENGIKSRIVQSAAELFGTKGYRSVTLSELASRLGMSKKTLYLHFSGKEEIAEAVLERTMDAVAAAIADIRGREGEPLDMFADIVRGIKREIVKLSPLFIEDVQKYLPSLWERLETFRARQLAFMESLLRQAQERGLIRELDPKLTASIMLESVQHFVRPDFAAKHGHTMVEVVDTLFTLFIEGLRASDNK